MIFLPRSWRPHRVLYRCILQAKRPPDRLPRHASLPLNLGLSHCPLLQSEWASWLSCYDSCGVTLFFSSRPGHCPSVRLSKKFDLADYSPIPLFSTCTHVIPDLIRKPDLSSSLRASCLARFSQLFSNCRRAVLPQSLRASSYET